MSTTLNKIVYNIAHSQSREDDLSYIERLKFVVHSYRATIIRRDLDRNKFTPSQHIQTIGCLEMGFVDASSCPDILLGCEVFRSKEKVPDPIRFKDRIPFNYVGTIDGHRSYSPMNSAAIGFISYSKYTSRVPRYYFDDGYIYLTNASPKFIRIKGVFEYPQQLSVFNTDDEICYSDDDPYPISVDLARGITEGILNFDVGRERNDNKSSEVELDG